MPKVELMNVLDIEKNEMEIAGWMASVSYDSKSAYEKIAKHCIGAGH